MFQYDLQGAMYAAIKADALITEETYDFVPEGVPGPYLVIGDSDMIPWDDKLTKGGEITDIRVFAGGCGRGPRASRAGSARRLRAGGWYPGETWGAGVPGWGKRPSGSD